MDSAIADFISITNASAAQADNYLKVSDGDLGQAIQLFFDTGGAPIDAPAPVSSRSTGPQEPASSRRGNVDSHDDDDDNDTNHDDDDDFRVALDASRPTTTTHNHNAHGDDDDEAIARRLQEEFYADASGPGGDTSVRAPIARTTETLVGPDEDYLDHMASRTRQTRTNFIGRPGIFNQRPPPGGVWAESASSSRHNLAAATGGASEQSSKHHTLAEMYRPPYEIMQHVSFEEARDQAKEEKKWILVNIQDSSIFDCQVLNRDIWKNKEVKDTIKENFLFLQYDRAGIDGQTYVRLYFPHAIDVPPTSQLNPFPIVAIVDPRTGEQVKVWSETPKKPMDFVMQLHEFLDRYSLLDNARNPVQKKSKPKVDIDHMTEEEMLEMALRNSLDKNRKEKAPSAHDPDELTRSQSLEQGSPRSKATSGDRDSMEQDLEPTEKVKSAFDLIPANKKYKEPPMSAPNTTRIQLKLADGSRVVRRFALSDPVSRIYEYIKADLLPERAEKAGEAVTAATSAKPFELVSLGKNLIEALDKTIEQAGLKMGTIMIEFAAEE